MKSIISLLGVLLALDGVLWFKGFYDSLDSDDGLTWQNVLVLWLYTAYTDPVNIKIRSN